MGSVLVSLAAALVVFICAKVLIHQRANDPLRFVSRQQHEMLFFVWLALHVLSYITAIATLIMLGYWLGS